MQPCGSLNASRIDNMNLKINLRPDPNEPLLLNIPVVDSNGNPVLVNGQPQIKQVLNPSYVPARGKSSIIIYAKNHNVLRIVNGFAGLLFKI
jgi:hypothetical protein